MDLRGLGRYWIEVDDFWIDVMIYGVIVVLDVRNKFDFLVCNLFFLYYDFVFFFLVFGLELFELKF